jgi:hypothetical protein
VNISQANTEPFHRFHRFNEELNRSIKVSIGGLTYVEQNVAAARNQGVSFTLPNAGEPWGSKPWNTADKAVVPSKMFIAQMGVVRHITSLEDFCLGVKAEYDRHCGVEGLPVPGLLADMDEEGFPPSKLYELLKWDKDVLEGVGPLYDYFSLARNCIVHRSGRASRALKLQAGSLELATCIEHWHGRKIRRVPTLPVVQDNDELLLLPRHAVLAGEVGRRIAVDANEKLREFLGLSGLLYMAAYHSMFSEQPVRTPARRFPYAILNYILTDRYHVRLSDRAEAEQMLRKIGKWTKYETKWKQIQK